jgi:hypothetical protein
MSSRRPNAPPAGRQALLAVALAASIMSVQPGAALAQGLLETLTQGPRLRTDPGEPADWVRASRPAVIPDAAGADVGARQPRRALLTPDDVRRKERELDALRVRHDRISGRKPATGKFRSAAAEPVVKTPKKEVRCALTCAKTIGTPPRR